MYLLKTLRYKENNDVPIENTHTQTT